MHDGSSSVRHNVRGLSLVSPHQSYNIMDFKTKILSTTLPDPTKGWLLSIEIEGDAKKPTQRAAIPTVVSNALLKELRHAFTADIKDQHDCENFVRIVVSEAKLPLLAQTEKSSEMQPWWPISLHSKVASDIQNRFNVTRPPEFLHSALWVGIGGYYICKMGGTATFLVLTLVELLKIYPTAKRILFSRPFQCGCVNPSCEFFAESPPTTQICSCRQAQYCSEQCQTLLMAGKHRRVCDLVTMCTDKSPWHVLSNIELKGLIERLKKSTKESFEENNRLCDEYHAKIIAGPNKTT
jgi:hypothetical protein